MVQGTRVPRTRARCVPTRARCANPRARARLEGTMRLRLPLVAALLLAAPLVTTAGAQEEAKLTITGRVTDAADSAAIARAVVDVPGTDVSLRTNGFGRFRITGLRGDARELVVRAIGYEKVSLLLAPGRTGTVDVGDIRLERNPQLLSQMVVQGRAARVPRGFAEVYRRGLSGRGKFITREQIDSLNPAQLKTVLFGINGVYVNQRGVYFNRCMGGQVGQLWVDGTRVTRFNNNLNTVGSADPNLMNEMLTTILPVQVQAIEVYPNQSSIPAEFMDAQPCAVIAVWTRRDA